MIDDCESGTKKLARVRIWEAFEIPSEGPIAVLAGFANGDALHLRYRGVPEARIRCIDANRTALKAAQKRAPGADYRLGDFVDHLPGAAGFFLDGVSPASPESADYFARCVALMPEGAPVACAFMVGRYAGYGRAPRGFERAAEWWRLKFQREIARTGTRFACTAVIGYKGRGTPMLAFVGRVGAATVSLGRMTWLSPRDPEGQVRRAVLARPDEADKYAVPRSVVAAWKAVRTREAGGAEAEKKRAKRNEQMRARREKNREKERERDRAWREKNLEKKREQYRAWYAENREKKCEQARAYSEANREKKREQARAYSEANREKVNERKRVYREANREKERERDRARYAVRREKERERKRARYAARD